MQLRLFRSLSCSKLAIGLEGALPQGVRHLERVKGLAHAYVEFAIVHDSASFSSFRPRDIQE